MNPKYARHLSPSERRFLDAMNDLNFGRFEHLKIANGELVTRSQSLFGL